MTQTDATLLVGDVGGTHVRLTLASCRGGGISLGPVWKRRGEDFPTFDAALATFRKDEPQRLDGAAFGMAGPVTGDRVELLHRGWSVDGGDVARQLGVSRALIVNDFVAMARSAPDVSGDDSEEIAAGEADPEGSIAVGGPGTGFGLGVVRKLSGDSQSGDGGWVVVGGEGGHQAYGPQTDLEWKVAQILTARLGYVSNEVVASGSGHGVTLAALEEAMGVRHRNLSAKEAGDLAAQGDAVAVALARLRARTVMTSMGNLTLLSHATGGVFLAGGVTTRIAPWLREREALDRFYRRGARTDLMARIPIRMITAETAPLMGAARLWLDEQRRGWL